MPIPRRVLVADHSSLTHFALAESLKKAADLEVVAQVDSAEQAIAQARQHCPHVALLDLQLPDGGCIKACQEIQAHCPKTCVLILADIIMESALGRAWMVGAAGYVLRSTPLKDLIKAIRSVANGRRLWTLDQLEGIQEWRQSIGQRLEEVTERQWDVLRLVADGKNDPQICEALTISLKTVKRHINDLYAKLDIHTRADLIVFFYKEGLAHWGQIQPQTEALSL